MSASPDGWELVSISGREAARWTLAGFRGEGHDAALVCDVTLEGQYHGETLGASVEMQRPDFRLAMRGLELRQADLERLAGHVREWLALSPAALGDPGLGLTCGMGALFDQSLTLAIGRRDDVISGGRPVATLAFSVGRMRGDLRCVVDGTGLTRFADRIETALRSVTYSLSLRGRGPG